ncbi:hypothetical protein PLICRDRAFT_42725 [Plicaturopsis crispa FD-325 SS-3]|nr:hypothetical protein PLICRDRAFT_42725 [Plicaturopsis crispa FD-325 SS-3]
MSSEPWRSIGRNQRPAPTSVANFEGSQSNTPTSERRSTASQGPVPRRRDSGWSANGGSREPRAPDSHPQSSLPSSAKRRRLDIDPEQTSSKSPSATAMSAAKPIERSSVKREESPAPLRPSRTLLTSGAKHCAPMPPECQKSHPDCQRNRAAWAARERRKLEMKGIRPIRSFIRADGMVIDWESDVPIWSDTLQPENSSLASTIAQVNAANQRNSMQKKTPPSTSLAKRPSNNDVIIIDDDSPPRVIPPPRPPPRKRGHTESTTPASAKSKPISSAQTSVPASTEQHQIRRLDTGSVSGVDTVASGSNLPAPVASHDTQKTRNSDTPTVPTGLGPLATGDATVKISEDILNEHKPALEFLSRYTQMFDHDRSALTSAYAQSALFSYRLNDVSSSSAPSKAELFAPRSRTRETATGSRDNKLGIKQGRLEIMGAILTFGPHKFCPHSEPATIDYDVVYIRETMEWLLTACTKIEDRQRKHSLICDQSFILRKRDANKDDLPSGSQNWPLVAVSHQMTIRDVPPRVTQD